MAVSRLTDIEIESVLKRAPLVRVAFIAPVPYVLTFGFALLNGCLVGQTGEGQKTKLARSDSRVGFQVDTSLDDGVYSWESVRGEGRIAFSPPDSAVLEATRAKFPDAPEWFVQERFAEFADGSARTFSIQPTTLHGIRERGAGD